MFHFLWLCFYLKMSYSIYHMSSRATKPDYQPLGDTKALARCVTRCRRQKASGDVTRQGFRVTSRLIFWYVTLEAMWYMYNVTLEAMWNTGLCRFVGKLCQLDSCQVYMAVRGMATSFGDCLSFFQTSKHSDLRSRHEKLTCQHKDLAPDKST